MVMKYRGNGVVLMNPARFLIKTLSVRPCNHVTDVCPPYVCK